MPEGVQASLEGLREVRFIGESEGALVYAAQQADMPWCVVVVLPGRAEAGDWTAGSSCADDARFAKRGVWTKVSGGTGQHGEALLLPDDFAGEVGEGWQVVGPNLAVPVES
ncbi:hypothetical protein [Georgenia sp. AZ-5]|uniref:hypothetical protein n=1 Tax=Georgenia sp. AZ-5 TaxID=3367526 RepID=UPI0037547908